MSKTRVKKQVDIENYKLEEVVITFFWKIYSGISLLFLLYLRIFSLRCKLDASPLLYPELRHNDLRLHGSQIF